MSVDNSILTYNNDAIFSGDATEWYITCTKGGRITAKTNMYVDVYIVGGGGGGGRGSSQAFDASGGGGGGGGYRVVKKGLYLAAGSYTDITIGAGGSAGSDGGASSAFGYTAQGGSAGGNATDRYYNGSSWVNSVPGSGGSGGSAGGKGVYINGYTAYVSSDAGSDGGYAFDDSSWSSTKYGAGGGGGCAVTNSDNQYSGWINGYYNGRSSGSKAPGGATGGGNGGDVLGVGYNATSYGAGGGGGGANYHNGGSGYQGIVIIRSARGGYTLTIAEGTGSSIAVQRTSSTASDIRMLFNGAKIYSGDKLKITFSPQPNYELLTHTVNGSDFSSGTTHSVSDNTIVAATARPLASDVGATDANIESISTITVTKYVDTYLHSLHYSFGSLSGFITSSGALSETEEKFSSTSVAFTVPSSFYTQMPNSKSGTCTITCKTYETLSSTTTLGDDKTCTFTVTAAESLCAPIVSGTVIDTNSSTVALTGDNNILVRYKSSAECTITATAQNGASIASKKINGQTPNTNNKITIIGDSVTSGSFTFTASDSRGYVTSLSQTKTLVAYINLTINPVLYRPSPTSGEVALTFNGNFYRGSFGLKNNTLTIRYRYRESTASTWSNWLTVPSADYNIGTKTYSTPAPVLLLDENSDTDGFDYQKSYYFEVQAYDGADGTVLSSVSSTVIVQRGIPVFDWGENDFRFNVPICIGQTQLTEAQLIQLLALIT